MAQKDIKDVYDFDVVYDIETNGMVKWKTPSDDPGQPHIVQLAAVKCERKTGKVIQSIDLIIKPNGWEITEELTKIHGISHDYAVKVGIPEGIAVLMLLHLCRDSMRVSFNQTFDQRLVRIQLKRMNLSDDMDEWARVDNHSCAMIMSKWVMKLKPFGKYGPRNPNLAAAYKHFTNKELENAHGAMVDTLAAKEVFYSIVNANGGKIHVPGKDNDIDNDNTTESGDDSDALFGSDQDPDVLRTFDLEDELQPVDQDDPY